MFIIISHLLISLQYIYIIAGEELTKLGKDYIKYLLGGSKSVRLSNAMDALESFWKTLSDNKLVYDKYWLEKEILNTTTWFDGPEKYRRMRRSYMERSADESYMERSADEESWFILAILLPLQAHVISLLLTLYLLQR